MDRHLNEISFIKCGNPECCDPFTSALFEEFIKASDKKLKAPTLSSEKDGHYKTFLEECINANPRFGHTGQSSAQGNDLGRCTVCPNYSFTSKTEKMRHMSIYHRRQKQPNAKGKYLSSFDFWTKIYKRLQFESAQEKRGTYCT